MSIPIPHIRDRPPGPAMLNDCGLLPRDGAMDAIQLIISSGIVAALVSGMIGRWANEKIEKVKADLKLESFRRETMFASGHPKRVQIIEDLHRLINVAHEALKKTLSERRAAPIVEGVNDDQEFGVARDAWQAYQGLEAFYTQSSIHLSDELSRNVAALIETLKGAILHAFLLHMGQPSEELREKVKQTLREKVKEFETQRIQVVLGFREALGYEDQ